MSRNILRQTKGNGFQSWTEKNVKIVFVNYFTFDTKNCIAIA